VTVSQRLVGFMRHWAAQGVPGAVRHEALRLLVNQLKASVGATTHPAVATLHAWATADGHASRSAPILWFGSRATPEQAAVVNGALCEVLDFNDTYIPTFMHATSGVLPALLAAAAETGAAGAAVLDALALGLEVELACATILMPTGYYRGFVPGGLVGAIGGAAACGLLYGLDDNRLCNALGIAMCTAFGTYESVGSDTLPSIMGLVARNGLTAARLAAAGITAPATAFEGEKGMLSACSSEPADKIDGVLITMAAPWRIFGNTYKTVPTETITHAPIECVMDILPRARGRTVARMTFGVQAIVVAIADERRARFGAPASELQARFDLRFCAAAAWQRGCFGLDEMRAPCFTDPAVLALRDQIDLVADPAHASFEGASLRVDFTDGTDEQVVVPAFLGTPTNKLSDHQLSALLRTAAAPLMPAAAIDRLLDAAWRLPEAANTATLTSAACLPHGTAA
jgi:2-methylcitrate dehydratase PrpD